MVTSIPAIGTYYASGKVLKNGEAQWLYEEKYCGRGNAENQIKQMVLDFKTDRTSSSCLASNHMRLRFSTLTCLFLEKVRKIGPKATEWAEVSLGTLRLRVLNVAVCVRVSVPRVHVTFYVSSAARKTFLILNDFRHFSATFLHYILYHFRPT